MLLDGRCTAARSGYDRASSNPLQSKASQEAMSSKRTLSAPVFLKNDWVIMDAFDAISADKEAIKDKVKAHAKKEMVRKTLDEQIILKEKYKQVERDRETKFLRDQNVIMEQWNYEQNLAHSMEHNKMHKEKRIRDEQCRINKIQRDRKKKTEEDEATQAIAICQREMKRAEDNKITEKQINHSMNVKNMDAVMQQFGKREKAEKEEKAEDFKLMIQMKEMMLAQDIARKAAFQKRVEKYDEFSSKWQESGAGKQQREAELKIERKILAEAAEKEAKDDKREVDDKVYAKKMAMFLQTENQKMVDRKVAKDRKMEQDDFRHACTVRQAGEAYAAGHWERENEEKAVGRKYAVALAKQRDDNARRITKLEMGDVERALNRQKILKLQNDPSVIKDIQDKMFVKRKMKESDKFKYCSNLPGFSKPGE